METLFEAKSASAIRARISLLRPDSPRQWGKMNAAQALAHCTLGLQLALGEVTPPRTLIGWTLGPLLKKFILKEGEPMRRSSPTVKGLVVPDDRELGAERARIYAMMDRFTASGADGCTRRPHSFLGRLTPQEWGVLMYKHLDHHLRQFGV